ncbi:hypothetical protein L226DRAFT_220547 [Lentinus tigrinus ALCF2SS1-7]|uniref:uncharacterized protein n=1 Tax=Lentinus tigrinus ALCF2SS1-7 TaxID=1328758 RepID=UPI001165F90E|nr:hypothetical protein L226DRAFT_220547 [Lentinus tigrinus ALCF2SS1-7]
MALKLTSTCISLPAIHHHHYSNVPSISLHVHIRVCVCVLCLFLCLFHYTYPPFIIRVSILHADTSSGCRSSPSPAPLATLLPCRLTPASSSSSRFRLPYWFLAHRS